ncbi:MAG: hypothetical protein CUN48_15280, partial [Candidatus Thermofonsia Clade 3 bacterium]
MSASIETPPRLAHPKRAVFSPDALAGRVALITGGSSGIGLGIAEAFAELGATIVITGRKPEKLAEAEHRLAATGARLLALAADVRDYAATRAVIERVVEEFGALDVLVNNAAGNFNCPFEDMTPNGWRTVIDIDLNGTFN